MILKVGLENGIDGRSVAWALEHPGCFSQAPDGDEALLAMPKAFLKYCDWVASHTPDSWLATVGDFDIRLVETCQDIFVDRSMDVVPEGEGIEIDAFFRHDWKPLTHEELERGLSLLRWSRADLLAAVNDLESARLDTTYPGERWSIRGILAHVASAEWWYQDRLGLTAGFPQSELPEDAFQRLDAERAWLEGNFLRLEGKSMVAGVDGELWSPRKLLRYALWHELDHVGHIYRLRLAGG